MRQKNLQDLWTDGSGNKDMEESERTQLYEGCKRKVSIWAENLLLNTVIMDRY